MSALAQVTRLPDIFIRRVPVESREAATDELMQEWSQKASALLNADDLEHIASTVRRQIEEVMIPYKMPYAKLTLPCKTGMVSITLNLHT